VRTIGAACDLVLCLLPFESDFYARHGVHAEFVGHPLADQIPLTADRYAARAALGIDPAVPCIAILPGSRLDEVTRLAPPFAAAAARIVAQRPAYRFIAPMASSRVRAAFEEATARVPGVPPIQIIDGQAQQALAAADGALVASGTATLETLLTGRPMVVAYRMSPVTAFVLRTLGLVKVQYGALPNLLAGRRLVPEFLQEAVQGPALADALLAELEDPARLAQLRTEFTRIHEQLRRGGAALAAEAILRSLGRGAQRAA
jgi:lipid-A-disaccharide synthase